MKVENPIEYGQIGYISDADAARRLLVTRERIGQIRRELGILLPVTDDGEDTRLVAHVAGLWIAVPDTWEPAVRVCETLPEALRIIGARPLRDPYPETLGEVSDAEIARSTGRTANSVASARRVRAIAAPRRQEHTMTGVHRETTCYIEHINEWVCVLRCDGEPPIVGRGRTRAEAQAAADLGGSEA